MPNEINGLKDYLSHLEEGYGGRGERRKRRFHRLRGEEPEGATGPTIDSRALAANQVEAKMGGGDLEGKERDSGVPGSAAETGAEAGEHGAAVEDVQVPGSLGSAALGSEPADLDEKDDDSNLVGEEPEVGMLIEIRDPDYIWSSASIVGVQDDEEEDGDKDDEGNVDSRRKKTVTVRYDGWGPEWDETISWPNIRVSRIFTYTKRVRCFVDLLSKKKPTMKRGGEVVTHCSLWPCTVSFRMPHPAHKERAEELLRVEPNVFVQPYGINEGMLPVHVAASLANGGRWIKAGRLRRWRNDTEGLGMLPKNFEKAHKMGIEDSSTLGILPNKPIEMGSLLNSVYRVHELGGEPVNGNMFTGEIESIAKFPKVSQKESSNSSISTSTRDCSDVNTCKGEEGCDTDKSSEKSSQHEATKRKSIEEQLTEQLEYKPPKYVPPPKMPKPIKLKESLYPSGGVSRFEKSKRWGASVSLGGNDLFLGSFPTQTQAKGAIDMALENVASLSKSSSREINGARKGLPTNEMAARAADLRAINLEDSVHAVQQQWTPENNFSLHEWTMQQIRHKTYLREKQEEDDRIAMVKSALEGYRLTGKIPEKLSRAVECKVEPLPKRAKKRKQNTPRRFRVVHL